MLTIAKLGNKGMGWVALAAGLTGAYAAAQPNIEVRINNTIQTQNQEFVFDATDVGESTPLIVVVRNIGSQNLQFPSASPIFVSGGFAGQFTLIQPPLESGNILSPNGSTAFRVDFTPTIPRRFMSALVSIPTNDPDSPIFNLNLRGVVPVPQMVITRDGQVVVPQSQVNLPPTPIGQSSEVELLIENRGERPLILTAPLDTFGGFGRDSFSIVQPTFDTIQPSEAATFIVVFTPTRTGSLSANVGISSNDIGSFSNGRHTFVVRGVGQPAQDNDDDADDGQNDDGQNDDGQNDDNDNTGNDGGLDDGQPTDDDQTGNDQTGDDLDNAGNGGNTGDNADAGQDAANGVQDDAADAADETIDAITNDVLAPVGLCGFGAPVGLACCLASLAAGRTTRRRRNR